jgi:hypothetical protein
MKRFLCRWIAAFSLVLGSALPLARADDASDLHPNVHEGILGSTSAAPADQGDKTEKPPPTLCYAVAVIAAAIVLCIICVPSRKSESSTAR